MTREEIEKLGLTIRKRLGKKANALWWKAERDLFAINIIRNHITRVLKFDMPKEITKGKDYSSSMISYWYAYSSKKADEEAVIFITEWLRNNIDKESLRKWLDEVAEDESSRDDTDKTLTIPKETLNKALDIYFKNKNYTIEKVPITQLVNDNDLLNNDDLESYHKKTWNNAKATDLSIDENKLNKMSVRDVPYVIKRNGKFVIIDGRHRIRAAYNNGYKFIEIPIINDEEKFINKKIKIEVKE